MHLENAEGKRKDIKRGEDMNRYVKRHEGSGGGYFWT